jgi:hypothetical protein
VLTLYVTPVFFVYMDTFQERVSARLGSRNSKKASDLAKGPIGG